ncbi:autotransporter outer membrane beta-barrel domain-containing protein [Bartonella rattimassiliensis]|uniref:Outer membrane autotransporter barrel domain-containing protein n=1 Tax=Bartonella rattimassiliensis 15908 TaxID=1094556 RepID=J0QHI9_9HYPH|nr:autotransporter outer membrane beta-barrel domain-containing protein [Bartonella rattimassiliensis]EJF84951.1 outer membrane autotransporter barrel domain-containing protein [Bartonella rattimassiliensis 15908]
MINVFKKRTSLYALTTSALFFLQGVDVSVANNPGGVREKVTVDNRIIDGMQLPNVGGIQTYKCNASSYKLDNAPVFCIDGKKHTIKYATIQATKADDVAVGVYPKINFRPQRQEDGSSVFAGLNMAGTTIKLEQVNITNNALPASINGYILRQDTDLDNFFEVNGGSAVEAGYLSRAELSNSTIKNFPVGLTSGTGGKIFMKKGAITNVRNGVMFFPEGMAILDGTVVRITETGVRSVGAGVRMKGVNLRAQEGAIGVIAENKGAVVLESSNIAIPPRMLDEISNEIVEDDPGEMEKGPNSVGHLLQDGFVAFDKSEFNATDAVFMWFRNSSYSNDINDINKRPSKFSQYTLNKLVEKGKFSAVPENFSSVNAPLSNNPIDDHYFGNVSSTLSSIVGNQSKVEGWRFEAYMKDGNVNLMGSESYGFYFDKRAESKSERRGANSLLGKGDVTHLAYMEKAEVNVIHGIGIYGENSRAHVVLDKKSKIDSKVLLRARSGSTLSVFASDSDIRGGADIDETSEVKLYLSKDSKWYLKENERVSWKAPGANCVDSCISSINLTSSTIGFVPPMDGKEDYKTLRIGKGQGKVYTAFGDSKIYMNVSVVPVADGAHKRQMSDRLLIHGDVEGKTTVYVNNQHVYDAVNRQKKQIKVAEQQNKSKFSSISLIQVYGDANKDSFKLESEYITLDGSPYQYILRAYGPVVAPGVEYFDARLVNSEKIWDFRLEGKVKNAGGNNNDYPSASDRLLGRYLPSDATYPISYDLIEKDPEFVDKLLKASPKDVFTLSPTMILNEKGEAIGYDYSSIEGVEDYKGFEIVDDELQTTDEEGNELSIVLLSGSNENAEYSIVGEVDEGYGIVVEEGDELTPTVVPSVSQPSELGSSALGRSDDGDSVNSLSEIPSTPDTSTSETGTSTSSSRLDVVSSKDPVSSGKGTQSVESSVSATSSTPAEDKPTSSLVTSKSESATPAKSNITLTTSDTGGDPILAKPNASNSNVLLTGNSIKSSEKTQNLENSASSTNATVDTVAEKTEGSKVASTVSKQKDSTPKTTVDTVVEKTEGSKAASTVSKQKDSTPKTKEAQATGRLLLSKTFENGEASSTVSVNSSLTSTQELGTISSGQSVASLGRSLVTPIVSVYNVQGTISSQCSDTTRKNGENKLQGSYSCSDGKSYTMKDLTLKVTGKTQHPMHAKNQNTVINLESATIIGVEASKNDVDFTKSPALSAVLAEEKAEVVLDKNSIIQSSIIGLEAKNGGKIKMNNGTVNAHYVGVLGGSESSVNLKGTKINVMGDFAAAGLASKAGEITMDSGDIAIERGVAVRSESGGSVKLDKVSILAKKVQNKLDSVENLERAAFLLSDNGSIDFKNGSVVTDAHALWIVKSDDGVEVSSLRRKRSPEVRSTMNRANIESSTVKVEGDGTYGIYFDGLTQKEGTKQNLSVVKRDVVKQERTPIGITGAISLKTTDFEVAKGIAIYGNNSGGRISLENKTTLAGDLLLKAENSSHILVSINNSIVKGNALLDKSSYARLDLTNKSEWILKRGLQNNLGISNSGCVDSCVSAVSLVNSTIDFAPSETKGKYQTLHIGNGKGTVYEAQGDSLIRISARLNPNDPGEQQVTDRLVIHGNVSGKTKIHVRGDAGNVGEGKANAKIAHSVSVIQVYGQAKRDSFQLDGNYVALRNSPYKYTLRAYGPEATLKQEHVQQKFVKNGGEFWNFRLENQYVKTAGSTAFSEQFVKSVVPQVPTYLILPNSVFHASLMDINNQNKQLETLRTTSTGMVDVRENPALYLRGYGGSYRYASDLSALEYGYGGDLDYRGVEAGVLLQSIETADSAMSFGMMGTYGKLSLQPLEVEQSQKSALDKWTATVYSSLQHNTGFYVDGLLSYGLFKGDVLTLARGKTATLKGNPLSVSLSGGQTIATGYKGFVFDPQVQVVYQHLQFNKARDIDNFDIEMGKLNQWVARVGGRLTKTPTGSEGMNAVAFYGKLYLAHGFGEKQSVNFKDDFQLGAFGSSLEAGLGFNAKLFSQFSLHADVLYQHKLNKAGFSGASFSGGVRYQF